MAESADFDPGPWRGASFTSARATYKAHIDRSYTDAVKAANPLASAILSSHSLTRWNFGTAAQYLAPASYRHTFDRALPAIFGMKYALVLFLPLLLAVPRLPLRAGLLGLGFRFGWRNVANGFEQSMVVEPGDPL